MRTINFYDYVSKRYATNDTRENRVRELVYAFKSGQRAAVDHAVKVVSDLLIKWYGVDCESYVFAVSRHPTTANIFVVSSALPPSLQSVPAFRMARNISIFSVSERLSITMLTTSLVSLTAISSAQTPNFSQIKMSSFLTTLSPQARRLTSLQRSLKA